MKRAVDEAPLLRELAGDDAPGVRGTGGRGPGRTALKPFAVTIGVFDSRRDPASEQDYVLPVDSPDAEHAVASTLANAASFTTPVSGGRALPVAFTC